MRWAEGEKELRMSGSDRRPAGACWEEGAESVRVAAGGDSNL